MDLGPSRFETVTGYVEHTVTFGALSGLCCVTSVTIDMMQCATGGLEIPGFRPQNLGSGADEPMGGCAD
ncbi:hypothetical protein PHLCEN_2v10303 [Hermanssonia centrifuga]|uniref:Uncharacterized protein n=1 Tax=Hermanssonia centrifuga TaxID=98765 RepID=A0A2R6NP87_9APHY|nr:hypothetical protein PHLCEN_2v10303 [Hermanssonia centrifuga]